ncbi:hypothetical protein D3C87_1747700 [compost metagenome]
MHRIGLELLGLDTRRRRLGRVQQRYMRLDADTKARDDTDAGDHHVVCGFAHLHFSEAASAASAAIKPTSSARLRTISPSGT